MTFFLHHERGERERVEEKKLRTCLRAFSQAIALELAVEPAFVLAQARLLFGLRAAAEARL